MKIYIKQTIVELDQHTTVYNFQIRPENSKGTVAYCNRMQLDYSKVDRRVGCARASSFYGKTQRTGTCVLNLAKCSGLTQVNLDTDCEFSFNICIVRERFSRC